MPTLCYAHPDFVMIVLFGVPLAWLVLPIFLYVILSAKNEKSNYSPRTKLAIRTILVLLSVIWYIIGPAALYLYVLIKNP
jgi:hypothetical protein